MDTLWRKYQKDVAKFFRSLGCTASISTVVKGARASHEIDVLVSLKQYELPIVWAIECKDWKSRVPKEKALTFYAVVQDIGADKGFMMSEKGFQPGAMKCVASTNVTLTSLAELKETTKVALRFAKYNRELIRLKELDRRLSGLSVVIRPAEEGIRNGKHWRSGPRTACPTGSLELGGKLLMARRILTAARDGLLPARYKVPEHAKPQFSGRVVALKREVEVLFKETRLFCKEHLNFPAECRQRQIEKTQARDSDKTPPAPSLKRKA